MESNSAQLNRVVVTGLGALTAVGNNAVETWHALVSGRQGAGFITQFDRANSEVKIACEVKGFDPVAVFGAREARKLDRSAQFALVSTREALEHSGLKVDDSNRDHIGIVSGTGIGGINTLLNEHDTMLAKGVRRVSPFLVPMMMPNAPAGNISMTWGLRGGSTNITTACASATDAIGNAFDQLRLGRLKVAVVNGNEAPLHMLAVAGFNNMTALSKNNDSPETASRPFDKNRSGFVTGEGSGTLILETLEHALARGANILAEVAGYGSTADAHHITAPDFNGAVRTMRVAMNQAGVAPEDMDYIAAHGTSTPLNDASETRAIKTLFGESAYNVHISSNKSMIGHTLGACGAINALACINAINTGVIPPTVNYDTPDPDCDLNYTPNAAVHRDVRVALSNSFGFGGHNACIVFKRYA